MPFPDGSIVLYNDELFCGADYLQKRFFRVFSVTRGPLKSAVSQLPRHVLLVTHLIDARDFYMIWTAFTLTFFAFCSCKEFTFSGCITLVLDLPSMLDSCHILLTHSAYLSCSSPQRLTFSGKGTHL